MKKLIALIILIIMMLTGQAVTKEPKQTMIPDATGETAAVCEATTVNTPTNETNDVEPQNAPCAASEPNETEANYGPYTPADGSEHLTRSPILDRRRL